MPTYIDGPDPSWPEPYLGSSLPKHRALKDDHLVFDLDSIPPAALLLIDDRGPSPIVQPPKSREALINFAVRKYIRHLFALVHQNTRNRIIRILHRKGSIHLRCDGLYQDSGLPSLMLKINCKDFQGIRGFDKITSNATLKRDIRLAKQRLALLRKINPEAQALILFIDTSSSQTKSTLNKDYVVKLTDEAADRLHTPNATPKFALNLDDLITYAQHADLISKKEKRLFGIA